MAKAPGPLQPHAPRVTVVEPGDGIMIRKPPVGVPFVIECKDEDGIKAHIRLRGLSPAESAAQKVKIGGGFKHVGNGDVILIRGEAGQYPYKIWVDIDVRGVTANIKRLTNNEWDTITLGMSAPALKPRYFRRPPGQVRPGD